MRALAVTGTVTTALLAACGPRGESAPAPTPAEKVSAAPVVSDAATTPVGPLGATDLRRVCRAALAAIHEQTVDAIRIEGLNGDVVSAAWRAPVDGGERTADCRVEKDIVTWRPTGIPNPALARWMDQSGDPVIRFALDGDDVTITQTLPDGTTATDDLSVAAEQEAR